MSRSKKVLSCPCEHAVEGILDHLGIVFHNALKRGSTQCQTISPTRSLALTIFPKRLLNQFDVFKVFF